MPIIISRKTGDLLAYTKPTHEQKDAAWEQIIRNYAQAHPDKLRDLKPEAEHLCKA